MNIVMTRKENVLFSCQMCDITREGGTGWQSVRKCEIGIIRVNNKKF